MSNARAPYNFVPLISTDAVEGELISHERFLTDRHTGYFTVNLRTVTPLFVRGMLTKDEVVDNKHSKDNPEPFMVNGQPEIPGSTLRGMIRGMFEMITFGKMHFVNDSKLVYRHIFGEDSLVDKYRKVTTDVLDERSYNYPSKRMHGGYLQRGDSESGWVIQPAQVHNEESFVLVDRKAVRDAGIRENRTLTTHQVWVKPASRGWVTGKQGVELSLAETQGITTNPNAADDSFCSATLLISSTVGDVKKNRHWHPAIYEAKEDADPIKISKQVWSDFERDRDLKRGIANRSIKDPGDVLFYLLDDKEELLFFGPTMFFRIPYENSIGQLYDDPTDIDFVDYTDALFGYVSDSAKRTPVAYAGRVSVTGATLMDDQTDVVYGPDYTLRRTPASPKPTTFQHYVEQPNGTDTQKEDLHHYDSEGAQLRGNKLFWRQKVSIDDLLSGNSDGSKENVETTMRPVKEETWFEFRVYFENLTDAELGALAWAITLGDATGEEGVFHMVGMGKPYGLGVVKLTSSLTLMDLNSRYGALFAEDGSWYQPVKLVETDFVQAFKNMLWEHGIDFDNDNRMQQLEAMLYLYEPDDDLFTYMKIKPNEYEDRPVLPTPREIASPLLALRKSTIEVGDIIRGEAANYDGVIYFDPEDIHLSDKWVKLDDSGIDKYAYEAQIPRDLKKKNREDGTNVFGRVVDIEDGDPAMLICEQVLL